MGCCQGGEEAIVKEPMWKKEVRVGPQQMNTVKDAKCIIDAIGELRMDEKIASQPYSLHVLASSLPYLHESTGFLQHCMLSIVMVLCQSPFQRSISHPFFFLPYLC